jgi:hypothetical protein
MKLVVLALPDLCRPRACFAIPHRGFIFAHGYRYRTNLRYVRMLYREGVQVAFRYF